MRFAIVESGGKQYRAVEGATIDVDRLAHEVGKKFDLERVLLMSDGDDFMIGAPIVSGISVSATVVEHVKGPKVISFKYRPKKRIRVKGGQRHQYTRLMIEFIGKPGEVRKIEAQAAQQPKQAEAKRMPKKQKPAKGPAPAASNSVKKAEQKAPVKKPASKPAAEKSSSKKTDSKKK